MIPPAGFDVATNFSGFQKAEIQASIMVTELSTAAQTLIDGFTADALRTRGMTLLEKKEMTFQQAPAAYITVSQSLGTTQYLKQMLIFGNSEVTVLVNGIYPEAHKNIEKDIRQALLTTTYNVNQEDDPLAAAPFTVDVSKSEFKIAKYMVGSLVYTTDGKLPSVKPMLMVGTAMNRVEPIADRKAYAIQRLKSLPGGQASQVKEVQPIQIDGLDGYEIRASGKSHEGKPQLVYQAMLFPEEGGYYILVGMTTEQPEANLVIFKRIARTFKRK
ncbi:hypothetical protein [Siphonobacter curvatus]|uniref:Uncharacterized protein n=1 Tax=Siphonobacter curvatus TaxID=2094562 RepID=A0A2S7IT00_9BACT|nr:hypothetical protein [Siphonobacter curvatus]PQA60847.1 hypothetical protein C5O19_14900 [Siphonobacter curvatus]